MSKRNLTLFIIILIIITAVIFGFFYLYQPKNQTGDSVENINFLADFLPFGRSTDTTPKDETPPVDVSGYEPPVGIEQPTTLKLRKASTFPIAGFGVFMKERFKDIIVTETTNEEETKTTKPTAPATELVPALRYVNKATGNIYQTFADKIDERKFSSMVVPQVYEAFFGNKGDSVIIRYLKTGTTTIQTFVGDLQKEFLGADSIGTSEVKGSFLPENISDVSISLDASKMFYLFEVGESAVGTTFNFSTKAKVQVFDSPFTEWLSFWPNSKMITLTTKPSANVPGYMYTIDPDKKDFKKILGNINGLTTLTSPDGKMVLYSNNNLSLNIFNIETKNSTPISVKTLPEKCVWGTKSDMIYCAVPRTINQAEYPDSWYQGEISFSDQIWKIDVVSLNTMLLSDPMTIEGGEEIDGIKLNLDENQESLFFVNKKDSYLWKLELN